jgi:hypothetical protein
VSQDRSTSVLEVPLLGCESSLTSLEARFKRRKACELTFKPEVVQGLPLLQLLLQLIHRLLPFFNGADTHSKLLRLLMVPLAQASAEVYNSLASASVR